MTNNNPINNDHHKSCDYFVNCIGQFLFFLLLVSFILFYFFCDQTSEKKLIAHEMKIKCNQNIATNTKLHVV